MVEAAGIAGLHPPGAALVPAPRCLETRHRRVVLIETLIGAALSGIAPAVIIALTRAPGRVPLLAGHAFVRSLILGTLGPALGITIGITLVIRSRVRRGGAPALQWPLHPPGLARFLPQSLIPRGLVAAIVATLILPPAGILLLLALGVTTLSKTDVVVYNLFHAFAMGALVLPLIVVRALADPVLPRRPQPVP